MTTGERKEVVRDTAGNRDQPLYKFRTFDPVRDLDPECQGHAASLLRDGLIYCASPHDLNDPWEGRPAFSMPDPVGDPTGFAAFLEAFVDTLPEDKKAGAEAWIRADGSEQASRSLQREHWQNNRGIGVFSVAGNAIAPLLWSYYSAGHRGFCWILDNTRPPFAAAAKVEYQPDYPIIDWANWKTSDTVKASLLTKGSHWEHEDEYRILLPRTHAPEVFTIVPHNGRGPAPLGRYLKIDPSLVKGIIFGAGMRREECAALIQLAGKFGRTLDFHVASIGLRKYEVVIRPLEERHRAMLITSTNPHPLRRWAKKASYVAGRVAHCSRRTLESIKNKWLGH